MTVFVWIDCGLDGWCGELCGSEYKEGNVHFQCLTSVTVVFLVFAVGEGDPDDHLGKLKELPKQTLYTTSSRRIIAPRSISEQSHLVGSDREDGA